MVGAGDLFGPSCKVDLGVVPTFEGELVLDISPLSIVVGAGESLEPSCKVDIGIALTSGGELVLDISIVVGAGELLVPFFKVEVCTALLPGDELGSFILLGTGLVLVEGSDIVKLKTTYNL